MDKGGNQAHQRFHVSERQQREFAYRYVDRKKGRGAYFSSSASDLDVPLFQDLITSTPPPRLRV